MTELNDVVQEGESRLSFVVAVSGVIAATAAIVMGAMGLGGSADSPDLQPVAIGGSTTTSALPTASYVPSAAPPVKASFFGKT